MISYKNLTIQQVSYIQDIIRAQNKIRTKLPCILSYEADKHFQYLCSSNKSINKSTLQNINPFRNSQVGFTLDEYSPIAIYALNTGQHNKCINNSNNKHHQLVYRGYIRLITTQRSCFSGGSQVNITLFHRVSLDHEISNYFNRDKIKGMGDDKMVDNIIGMLFFLQCLKISVLLQHQNTNHIQNKQSNQFVQTANKTVKKRGQRRRIFQEKPFNKLQFSLTRKYNHNEYLSHPKTLTRTPIINNYPLNMNPQYYQTSNYKSNKKIITQPHDNHLNPQYIPSYTSPSPRLKSSSVLEKFSSENNVWKNISERNWQHKQQFLNRSYSNTSAFSYETTVSPRTLVFNTHRTERTNKKPINTADRSYYYIS